MTGEQAATKITDDWIAKVRSRWWLLRIAPDEVKASKDVVLEACKINGEALRWASDELCHDRDVVFEACSHAGEALEHASTRHRADREIVLFACLNNGKALKYASNKLRASKEIVMAAVTSCPASLKYALGGLNQDADCLITSGLWDQDYGRANPQQVAVASSRAGCSVSSLKKIVLSTRFALTEKSISKATQFAILLKLHDYIKYGGFCVYSPNAVGKSTCDPKWTRLYWPCRGTFETCRKQAPYKTGVPQARSCWRYSFRFQLEQAKQSHGFMMQLVEAREPYLGHANRKPQILGDGQKIETEMAHEVGIKVFRVHVPIKDKNGAYESEIDFTEADIEHLVCIICEWYDGGCKDMSEHTIYCYR